MPASNQQMHPADHDHVLRTEESVDVVDSAIEERKMRWLARDAAEGLIKGKEVRGVVSRGGGDEEDLRPGLARQVKQVTRQRRVQELLAAAGDDAPGHCSHSARAARR